MATRTQRLIVFALVAVPAALIVGYRHFAQEAATGKTNWLFPEKAEALQYQPAPQSIADRTRFAVQRDEGADMISTRLPVSVTMAEVPMANIPSMAAETTQQRELDEHMGEMHGSKTVVSGQGAYIVRYKNEELCEGNICPMALIAKKDGPEQVGEVIFTVKAKNMWVSSARNGGNPDLIIDYGVPNLPPVRMFWNANAQYPTYLTYPLDGIKELPDLTDVK